MNRLLLSITLIVAGSFITNVNADESLSTSDPLGQKNSIDKSKPIQLPYPYKNDHIPVMRTGNFEPPNLRQKYWPSLIKSGDRASSSDLMNSVSGSEGPIGSVVRKSPVLSGAGVIYHRQNNSVHNPVKYEKAPVGDFYAGSQKGKWLENKSRRLEYKPGIGSDKVQGKLLHKE